MITTQKELRSAFWDNLPDWLQGTARVYKGSKVRQNAYPTDTRLAWIDFVDDMHRSGEISDALANRATL